MKRARYRRRKGHAANGNRFSCVFKMIGLACVAVGVIPTISDAQPIGWYASDGGNNHSYEYVMAAGIPWDDARAAAEARTFEGVPGHLVTITSVEESDFLQFLSTQWLYGAWLGGW